MLRAAPRLRLLSPLTSRTLGLARPAVARALSSSAVDPASATAPGLTKPSAAEFTSVLEELERLEALPWYKSGLLKLAGTFSDTQKQAAAGCDMFMHCRAQSFRPELYEAEAGGLEDRYYRRFQAEGLHCWLALERLRQEPKETYEHMMKEMMEKVWDKATLDLSEQGMDFIKTSKHLKEMQLGWHGMARLLDEALHAESPRDEFAGILLRNMYVDEEGNYTEAHDAAAGRLADYVMAQRVHLRTLPPERMLKAQVEWGPMVFSA